MTGENEQLHAEFSPEEDPEPQFRYLDLAFEDVGNQQSYEQYQRLAVTLKQNHTKLINTGLDEPKKQNKQPDNKSLAQMVSATRDYYLKTSQAKLEK